MTDRSSIYFVHYNYLINNAPYQVHFLFMKGANPE